MNLAFATGALASALAAAGLTALVVWVVTVIAGSSDPWSVGPWLIPGAAAAVIGGATFLAERYLHSREERAQASDRRALGVPRRLGVDGQWPARSAPWPFLDASATTFSAMLCGTSA